MSQTNLLQRKTSLPWLAVLRLLLSDNALFWSCVTHSDTAIFHCFALLTPHPSFKYALLFRILVPETVRRCISAAILLLADQLRQSAGFLHQ